MVDFAKLRAMTPAEREEAAAESAARFEAQQDELLAKRRQQLQAARLNPRLTSWERDFLDDMDRKAAQPDLVGRREGGNLLYLSDNQVRSLERLAAAGERERDVVHPPAPPVAALTPPAAGGDMFSRMARFAGRASAEPDESTATPGARPRG